MIRITVKDSGPGLDSEIADKIFDPFVTTKGTGMGMGLSICRTIVEAHHGKLTVEENEPFGTLFRFTLEAAFSA
jgi:two-component system sensor kinase FixL